MVCVCLTCTLQPRLLTAALSTAVLITAALNTVVLGTAVPHVRLNPTTMKMTIPIRNVVATRSGDDARAWRAQDLLPLLLGPRLHAVLPALAVLLLLLGRPAAARLATGPAWPRGMRPLATPVLAAAAGPPGHDQGACLAPLLLGHAP